MDFLIEEYVEKVRNSNRLRNWKFSKKNDFFKSVGVRFLLIALLLLSLILFSFFYNNASPNFEEVFIIIIIVLFSLLLPIIIIHGVINYIKDNAKKKIDAKIEFYLENKIKLSDTEENTIISKINFFLKKLNFASEIKIILIGLRSDDMSPFILSNSENTYLFLPNKFLALLSANEKYFNILLAHEIGHLYQKDSETLSESYIAYGKAMNSAIILLFMFFLIGLMSGEMLILSTSISFIVTFQILKLYKMDSEYLADFAAIAITKHADDLVNALTTFGDSDNEIIKLRIKNIIKLKEQYAQHLDCCDKVEDNLIIDWKSLIKIGYFKHAIFGIKFTNQSDSEEHEGRLFLFFYEERNKIESFIIWLYNYTRPVELCKGRQIGNEIFLKGYKAIDEQNEILLDEYTLELINFDAIRGITRNGGNWSGVINGEFYDNQDVQKAFDQVMKIHFNKINVLSYKTNKI